jgi:hypothetical protein
MLCGLLEMGSADRGGLRRPWNSGINARYGESVLSPLSKRVCLHLTGPRAPSNSGEVGAPPLSFGAALVAAAFVLDGGAGYGVQDQPVDAGSVVEHVVEGACHHIKRLLLRGRCDYIEDIDFLPIRRLAANGKLAPPFSDSERRGQELFRRPFAHDPSLSCAVCHPPHGLFVDHEQHDVGSGGAFKTPTLINANFNGPYFHDGRYTDYARVVAHFDPEFYLGLSVQDRRDLVAYLEAVGDGKQATQRDAVETRLREISDFATVLDTTIADHDAKLAVLAVDTIDRELRDRAACRFPRVNGTHNRSSKGRGGLVPIQQRPP